jgi:hypothetical protein
MDRWTERQMDRETERQNGVEVILGDSTKPPSVPLSLCQAVPSYALRAAFRFRRRASAALSFLASLGLR